MFLHDRAFNARSTEHLAHRWTGARRLIMDNAEACTVHPSPTEPILAKPNEPAHIPRARSHFLELPRELRDHIYSFLGTRKDILLAEYTQESRVWEVHISHYPAEHALLLVSQQISSEFTAYAYRLFSASKLLVSTNAMTSAIPEQIKSRRVRHLLSRVPNVVLRAMADSKWWVSYSQAQWPHHLLDQIWPLLGICTSIEFISQLVGGYIFIPSNLRQNPSKASITLRDFFEYQIPQALFLPSKPHVIKTLVLEQGPFESAFSERDPSRLQNDFRSILNAGGAKFPETWDWFDSCMRTLDPLLCRSRLSRSLERYHSRAVVYRVVEEIA
jgi:hypothetical protein